MLKAALGILFLLVCSFQSFVSNSLPESADPIPLKQWFDQKEWVDSVYQSMTWDQRIGQMFMIRAHSNKGSTHEAEVLQQIKNYHVGSLLFFQGTPAKQAFLINGYQKAANIPLLVGMDAEYGLGMRLKTTDIIRYPYALTLGAIQDGEMLEEMGREIARQCRRLGIHINFAPVADVNNNINNPVIHMRSFGEDKYNVAEKAYYYMKGLQDGQVLACGKHFPGHGDTDIDSHFDLPLINHSLRRLDSLELYPFRFLIKHGLGSIMMAHLSVPAIDDRENRPTSLSEKAISDLLRKNLKFDRIVFTDGMEMEGVTRHFAPGVAEAEAIQAGSDIVMLPRDIGKAIHAVKSYISEEKIDTLQIEQSVRKILTLKHNLGLAQTQQVQTENLSQELYTANGLAIKRKLYEHAVTLVRDKQNLIPIVPNHGLRLASLSIGTSNETAFQQSLRRFENMQFLQSPMDISSSRSARLKKQLANKDLVIVSLHGMTWSRKKNYGLSPSAISFLEDLQKETKVIVVVFGTPYSLGNLDNLHTIIASYEDDPHMQDISAQALMGASPLIGKLPVTASKLAKYMDGISLPEPVRLGYDIPERVGLISDSLDQIDALVNEAVSTKATPGAVVLTVKDGKIVYAKAFGYHTPEGKKSVARTDMYDLASITKVAATTLAIMKLYENGELDINERLGKYIPSLDSTNKADLIIYDVLAHQARLKPWIPFYLKTIIKSRYRAKPDPDFYAHTQNGGYSIPVANKLFLLQSYRDSMTKRILDSDLLDKQDYVYSDLGFYLLTDLVEAVSGKTLEEYVAEEFYTPMGLQFTGFNPWKKWPLSIIAPSESDQYFRKQKVHGYVHDMGAAMYGGVRGHAGLFSSVFDLAAIFELLLNEGKYGGKQYLKKETINLFTTRHKNDTRRGLGFDMRQLDTTEVLNMSEYASDLTFGHLGFTGCSAWADPAHGLISIVLTNRTYPSMKNYKWSRENYRPRIQSAVYKAIPGLIPKEEIPPAEEVPGQKTKNDSTKIKE